VDFFGEPPAAYESLIERMVQLESELLSLQAADCRATDRRCRQAGCVTPKLAQAAVIAHFSAHPDSEPTAEEMQARWVRPADDPKRRRGSYTLRQETIGE
jgi:hypothetical protein